MRRHRRYRRNPGLSLAGLNFTQIAYGAGAILVQPMLERYVLPYLPSSLAGSTAGRLVTKTVTAAGIWYGAKKFFGPQAANTVAIALGATILADLASAYMPSLGLGMYTPRGGQLRAYIPANRRGLGLVTPGQIARGGFHGPGVSPFVGPGASRSVAPGVFEAPF